MQKVEGSSPFIRFSKSPAQAGFFAASAGSQHTLPLLVLCPSTGNVLSATDTGGHRSSYQQRAVVISGRNRVAGRRVRLRAVPPRSRARVSCADRRGSKPPLPRADRVVVEEDRRAMRPRAPGARLRRYGSARRAPAVPHARTRPGPGQSRRRGMRCRSRTRGPRDLSTSTARGEPSCGADAGSRVKDRRRGDGRILG